MSPSPFNPQCPYINGSPQNTFVPGVIELACERGVPIGGDDFKSGQTKLKSVLVDFLVAAGIKPKSIVSYNHLGNNDGKNLSAPAQFRYYVPLIIRTNGSRFQNLTIFSFLKSNYVLRSKEISKSNVVDDMVASNKVLYKAGETPDHTVGWFMNEIYLILKQDGKGCQQKCSTVGSSSSRIFLNSHRW